MSESRVGPLQYRPSQRPPVGDPAWQVLVDYVTALQPLLGLTHWEILIIEGDAPEDSSTFIEQHTAKHADSSDWYFGERFFVADDEEQRVSILHELIHLHDIHSHHDLLAALKEAVPPSMWEVVKLPHERARERTVDRLARAIAPKYDLIAWPEKTTTGE